MDTKQVFRAIVSEEAAAHSASLERSSEPKVFQGTKGNDVYYATHTADNIVEKANEGQDTFIAMSATPCRTMSKTWF